MTSSDIFNCFVLQKTPLKIIFFFILLYIKCCILFKNNKCMFPCLRLCLLYIKMYSLFMIVCLSISTPFTSTLNFLNLYNFFVEQYWQFTFALQTDLEELRQWPFFLLYIFSSFIFFALFYDLRIIIDCDTRNQGIHICLTNALVIKKTKYY